MNSLKQAHGNWVSETITGRLSIHLKTSARVVEGTQHHVLNAY